MERQIAVVTGANRGIGFEISRQLAAAGLHVILTARDESKGNDALRRLRQNNSSQSVEFHPLDVTKDDSAERFVAYLNREHQRVDVLINNAGILFDDDREHASVLTQTEDRFQATMQTNFYGPLRICQKLLPLVRKSGSGRIINVSSNLGLLPTMIDQYPAYGISKTAVNALTRMLASATQADGILVNAMCPGLVATDMGGPLGRPVEEGAQTAVWLALNANDGATGCCFRDREIVPW